MVLSRSAGRRRLGGALQFLLLGGVLGPLLRHLVEESAKEDGTYNWIEEYTLKV